MTPLSLSYKKSTINYYRLGYGKKLAVCFHGYGETAGSFSFLEIHAGEYYTFYSIDLPFHGLTEWKEGLNFSLEDLTAIVELITTRHDSEFSNYKPQTCLPDRQATNYPQGPADKLTLIGFSLGGRMCLNLYEVISERIEKMVLLAPDGLKVNFWYWLATQNKTGNKIFLFTMKHPEWFFGFLKALNKVKLINASIFKFVKYYINDKQVRLDLYQRWTGLRKIKPDIKKIKSLICEHKTPLRLIYGKHDRIIRSARAKKFQKEIEDYCQLKIIHSGHQVLHEKHVEEILPALLH